MEDSPLGDGRARLRASVRYESGSIPSEEYWFDVPRTQAGELSITGNLWLACLLPLAAQIGEPLRVPLGVDRPLLENANRLMCIWRAWYPELAVVSVEADPIECAPPVRPRRAAAFFSGGVDSFFTVLRRRDVAPPSERAPIDDLLTVWGFDVPLERADAFGRLRARHELVASELGKGFIDVATNLRSTRWNTAHWSHLAHGAGLAGVALSLEGRFHTVYIAGGGGYRGLHPWGSHSVTDPLFSSWRTAITYDAVAYLRTEKIERIADSATALGALRVCYESWTDENCGVCNKCQRTMLALEICGALQRCRTFPSTTIDLRRIAQMDCSHFADFRELQDIRGLAVAKGRADIVDALDRSLWRGQRNRRIRLGLAAIRSQLRTLRDRLHGRRRLPGS
ncbi:MAG TPA: hypothetical protein VMM18_14340 [Gemmatimonadaceae bacterium]|nr:hypothetical protein [Gemmatimonadaceae bacterium]